MQNVNARNNNFPNYLDQSHSSVERAGLLSGSKMRIIKTDDSLSMRGDALKAAIQADKAKGLIPFYVCILNK